MAREHDRSTSPVDDEDVTSSAAASTAVDETPESSPDAPSEEETLGEAIAKAVNKEPSDTDTGDAEEPRDDSDPAAADPSNKLKDQPPPDGEAQEGAENEEDEGADLEEGQRVPYDRFKRVIDQRNEYRERTEQIERERDEFREGHEQFGAITGFMQEHDLRPEDVSEALVIAAQFNSDPEAALAALKAKTELLQEFVGERLPADLQARVDSGEIDERDAQELVRRRNENTLLQQRASEAEQRATAQQRDYQVRQSQQAMAESANRVQADLAAKDPDFERKLPWIEKELKLLIQQHRPATADQAAQLVRQAHQSVSRDLERLVPRRQVRPGPSSQSTGGTASASPEPESMLEAMSRATGIPLE